MNIVRTIQVSTTALLMGASGAFAQLAGALTMESPEVLKARTEKIDYAAYFALNHTYGMSEKRPGFLSAADLDIVQNAAASNTTLVAYGISGTLQLYEASRDPALLQRAQNVFSALMDTLSGYSNSVAASVYDDVMAPLTTSALILKEANVLSIERLRQLHTMGEQWQADTFGRDSAHDTNGHAAASSEDTLVLPDPVFDLGTPIGVKRLQTATYLGLLFQSDKDFWVSRTRADQYFRYLLDRGHTGLREEPQASLALCTLISIARRLNRENELTALKPMFERIHADTLPNASVPHRLRTYQLRWTYALETAARLFGKAHYAYSAQKHFLAFHSHHNSYPELNGGALIHVAARETHLCAGLAAMSPKQADVTLAKMPDLSGITFDTTRQGEDEYASLVLRTGYAPDQAAFSLSLLAGPDSMRNDYRSALQMFVFDGVTLHEPVPPELSLGSEATQLWIQPAGIPFPFRQRDAEAIPPAGENPISAAYDATGFTWRKPSDPGRLQRHYVLSSIKTDRIGKDVSARLSFQQYGTPGTSLVRWIALTPEGYLVIADIVTPGEDAQTLAAGQLWRIPDRTSWIRNGGNWLAYVLDSPDPLLDQTDEPGTRGALVHFGNEWKDLYVGQKDNIMFSQRNLAQEPTTFAMVCVPLKHGQQNPRALARQISIRVSGERAGITLPDGLSITVSTDKWTVTRPAPAP